MKASFLTAAAVAGLLALSGCAAASPQSTSPESAAPAAVSATVAPSETAKVQPTSSAAAAATPAAAASTGSKVHFTGDYKKATAAETAKIVELSKQWHSPEKEAVLKAKMADAGLASSIPQEQVDHGWYARAAAVCQAKFDGLDLPLQGPLLEISEMVTGAYCPEVG